MTGLYKALSDEMDDDLVSSGPAILKFWKTACVPCTQLDRVLDSISDAIPEDISFFSAAAHENPRLVSRYQISSVPTLVLLNDGQEIDRVVGVERPQLLKRRIIAVAGGAG